MDVVFWAGTAFMDGFYWIYAVMLSKFFQLQKKKKDGWCILLLVNVRMDLIWLCFMDIGVYIGLFHIRNLGSRVLGMRGRDTIRLIKFFYKYVF